METEKIGLKIRPRKDGTTAYYWVASAVSRHADDYPNKTVRVHGATMDDIAARCRVLTSELKQWLAEKGMGQPQKFDGTLRSLIRMYQATRHPAISRSAATPGKCTISAWRSSSGNAACAGSTM